MTDSVSKAILTSDRTVAEVDKRAKKILFETYWSPGGWVRDRDRKLAPDDFEYAKERGLMFDLASVDHADAVRRLLSVIGKLDITGVADAFVASLTSRRLEQRSPLGAYAVFHKMPSHVPPPNTKRCNCCGLYLEDSEVDFNILQFERLKWGGVRHRDIVYAMFDLELFEAAPRVTPTAEDLIVFKAIIETIENLPPGISSAELQRHLPKALPSNKPERDVLVGILGYCGILATREHPGFATRFVPENERRLPDRHFVDMAYPACWWTSSAGINKERLNQVFGHLLNG